MTAAAILREPPAAHRGSISVLDRDADAGDPELTFLQHGAALVPCAPAAPAVNRRKHHRLSPEEFQWLRTARVKYGPEVRVVDISAGGILVETAHELTRGSKMVFELAGPDGPILVPARVLRCDPIDGEAKGYRSACAFTRPLQVPDLLARRDGDEASLLRSMADDILAGAEALATVSAGAVRRTADPAASELTAAGWQKVIVRYRDGQMLRGYTNNFHTDRPQLHLCESPAGGAGVMVPLSRLKALFFVREFAGDPGYVERQEFVGAYAGRRIEVTFHDGEVLVGSTMGYRYEGNGFFVQPADPNSNNQRVFVVLGAIQHVRFI